MRRWVEFENDGSLYRGNWWSLEEDEFAERRIVSITFVVSNILYTASTRCVDSSY